MASAPIPVLDVLAEEIVVLPQRETLQGLGINITVEPVIVVGNAIAVQAGTIGGSVVAMLNQFLVFR